MYKRILVILGLTLMPLSLLNAAALKRGPYLQNGNTTSVTVRWRTDTNTESVVRYGTSAANLSQTVQSLTKTNEHEIRLSGLQPNTKYFYAVGDADETLESGEDCFFITAPTSAKPTRVWLLGDPGTGTIEQKQVRDAYYKFTGSRHTDLWLMNGDNAMNNGNDFEFTAKLFAIYPDMLKKSVLWTAFGNHEGGASNAATQKGPYFVQHTYPTKGEAGGVASGTESYYSFDYGNIHFVILEVFQSDRSIGSPQIEWLKKDLAANKKDWTVAIVHYPPYTRGTEHSDKVINMRQVRENMNPILEANGVDLVISGHAHVYQRSHFVNGHYGKSETFDKNTMIVQKGNGRVGGDGAYLKDMSDKAFSGTVYVVAGASGKVGGNATNHPVMHTSMAVMGSLVMDFNGNQLDVTYLDKSGGKRDTFTIKKVNGGVAKPDPQPAPQPEAPANKAPTVKITSPAANASLTTPASLTIEASASDSDGSVSKVEFLGGGNVLGSASSSPYRFVWNNVPVGAQTITARAIDNDGAKTTSSSVLVNVSAAQGAKQSVTSFTLIDSKTNKPVPGYETIADGAVISRAALPKGGISIRVNTSPAIVGSVRIGFAGKTNFRTETEAPYALFGGPGEDYYDGTIANGKHTITGTPYTQGSGKGTAGESKTVTFTIADEAPAPKPEPEPAPTGNAVVSFTLMNADTNKPVEGYENITNGAVISRAALPTKNLSIRVNTNPAKVGSVRIGFAGKTNFRTESDAPYELFGGPVGDTYGGAIANGTHTITGTPFTGSGATGAAGKSFSVTFTISDAAAAPAPASAPAGGVVTSFTLMNADTDKPIPGYENIANGAVISRSALPTTRLSVRVNTSPAKVGSVRIGWNSSANYRTESLAPYELFGGPVGDTYAGTIANGTHTFTGTPYSLESGKGSMGTSASVTFTIR